MSCLWGLRRSRLKYEEQIGMALRRRDDLGNWIGIGIGIGIEDGRGGENLGIYDRMGTEGTGERTGRNGWHGVCVARTCRGYE
jgi:hypothetical protein